MKKTLLILTTAVSLVVLLATVSALGGSARFIGNKRSKKLHDVTHGGGAFSCQAYIKKMSNRNKVYFKSEAQANKKGYYLCKPCYY